MQYLITGAETFCNAKLIICSENLANLFQKNFNTFHTPVPYILKDNLFRHNFFIYTKNRSPRHDLLTGLRYGVYKSVSRGAAHLITPCFLNTFSIFSRAVVT